MWANVIYNKSNYPSAGYGSDGNARERGGAVEMLGGQDSQTEMLVVFK